MTRVWARLLCAVTMTAALSGLPGKGVAQTVLCEPSALLPLLDGAASRLQIVEGTHVGLDSSDKRLLESVTTSALRRARDNSLLAGALEQMATQAQEEGAQVSLALSPGDRRSLVRWQALCGAPRALPESEPELGILRPVTHTDNVSIDPFRGRAGVNTDAERFSGPSGPTSPLSHARSGSDPGEYKVVVHARGLFATLLAALAATIAGIRCVQTRDQLRSRRYPCHAPSSVRSANRSFPATILDVSQNGCKLRIVDNATQLRGDCQVRIGGCWRRGKIIWSNKHYAGVGLAEVLNRDVVQALARGTDEMSAAAVLASGPGLDSSRSARSRGSRAPYFRDATRQRETA